MQFFKNNQVEFLILIKNIMTWAFATGGTVHQIQSAIPQIAYYKYFELATSSFIDEKRFMRIL